MPDLEQKYGRRPAEPFGGRAQPTGTLALVDRGAVTERLEVVQDVPVGTATPPAPRAHR